ncbi:inositol-pentakisphosphate 2-kinase-domain-containing protein [Xylariaceae sp. FL0594]|nr:inositol-pentakisphosphate 2-kinase-domain-containing protein [Xylariaceae sp. FL0594]
MMDTIWTQRSADDGFDGSDTVRQCQQLVNSPQLVDFKYVAEGRANVVFSVWERREDGVVRGLFERTLLRVPKATQEVTPCDYQSLQAYHEEVVGAKVGRQHLVPQILVTITADVAALLNEEWARGSTRRRGAGSVIKDGHAMLVEDMGASPGYKALEFKPKWLAQSPLAPPGAKRCRSCAREAYRNSQLLAKGATTVSVPVCPLGLVHEGRAIVERTIDRLVPEWTRGERTRLVDALERTGILRTVLAIQTAGDPADALLKDPSSEAFGLAMTLRDCSLFVRMPLDDATGEAVELKLADTDKKNWEEKQTYWQETHRNLVENGWYTGTEKLDPPIRTECLLSN